MNNETIAIVAAIAIIAVLVKWLRDLEFHIRITGEQLINLLTYLDKRGTLEPGELGRVTKGEVLRYITKELGKEPSDNRR